MSPLSAISPSDTADLTRREKVAVKEAAIIAAARTLFNARGFAKTPISEIARESGVADGTVYLYFKNKQALAHAALSAFYDELTRTAQVGVDCLDTPAERLRFLARHHLEHVMANWRLLEMVSRLDITMETYGESEIYGLNRAYASVFDRVAKDAVAQGQIRDGLTPWVLRDIFFGSMDYGTRTILIKQRETDIDVFVDTLCALILSQASEDEAPDRLEAATIRLEQAAAKLEAKL